VSLIHRMCLDKGQYTKRDAQHRINVAAEHGRTGLRCYQCPVCNFWHLTRKEPFLTAEGVEDEPGWK
jgi:hypothetical protein